MPFTPIKDILPKTVQPQLINKPSNHGDFFHIFRQVLLEELGPVVSINLHPLFLKNGAVWILSFHRASADILRLKEKEIVDRMNSRLKEVGVRGIRLLG